MRRHTTRMAVLLLAFALVPMTGRALAQGDERLKIGGVGGWAAGYTDNDNQFGRIASHELAVDNYYLALNVASQVSKDVQIHSQIHWQADLFDQEVHVDHVFVDWKVSKVHSLRVGKIKNPLGVYTDIFDVGTLRPFYLLPQGLYCDVPEGYVGAGVNGRHPVGKWELEYDVIAGQMEFEDSIEDVPVAINPLSGQPVWASLRVSTEGRNFIGGGFVVHPPVTGLEIGSSYYSLDVWSGPQGGTLTHTATERTKVLAATGEYLNDRTTLRAEGMRVRGGTVIDAFFVEAAYKLTDHWQAAVMTDWRRRDATLVPVAQLAKHRSIGAALNYWVVPNVVFKLNGYHITGNRLARPDDAVNVGLAGALDNTTNAVVFGTQFSF
jgi:hypothetical protein